MDALREYKPEILEAHRHGLNIHRIAEIFRERGVDISKIHLMRAIRRFIEEEERAAAQGAITATGSKAETRMSATYQVVEQPSAVVQEEEFAKQLRIARYLAGTSLPAVRSLEQAPRVKKSKRLHSTAKARPVTKKETPKQKAEEKERRRAGRVGQKVPSAGPGRGEKQRPGPGR